ncbi:MAG: thiamine biosynthesis protein, partial [Acidimicrobiales bacterium]|nr:thiamine biosynthesis protein [Acidimicrobiales bacterium]
MTAVASRSTPTIHRVERVMGTAFGITVLDDIDPAVVAAAFALLHEVDARFSTYRPDSEVSLLGRGALDLDDATSEVREVFARCAELTELTDGSFTIDPTGDAGPGIADPSGLVKGWAIDRVTTMLRMAGATGFCVNGGGDLA